jgi:hypothetical protein
VFEWALQSNKTKDADLISIAVHVRKDGVYQTALSAKNDFHLGSKCGIYEVGHMVSDVVRWTSNSSLCEVWNCRANLP